jgi:hypothetical protein
MSMSVDQGTVSDLWKRLTGGHDPLTWGKHARLRKDLSREMKLDFVYAGRFKPRTVTEHLIRDLAMASALVAGGYLSTWVSGDLMLAAFFLDTEEFRELAARKSDARDAGQLSRHALETLPYTAAAAGGVLIAKLKSRYLNPAISAFVRYMRNGMPKSDEMIRTLDEFMEVARNFAEPVDPDEPVYLDLMDLGKKSPMPLDKFAKKIARSEYWRKHKRVQVMDLSEDESRLTLVTLDDGAIDNKHGPAVQVFEQVRGDLYRLVKQGYAINGRSMESDMFRRRRGGDAEWTRWPLRRGSRTAKPDQGTTSVQDRVGAFYDPEPPQNADTTQEHIELLRIHGDRDIKIAAYQRAGHGDPSDAEGFAWSLLERLSGIDEDDLHRFGLGDLRAEAKAYLEGPVTGDASDLAKRAYEVLGDFRASTLEGLELSSVYYVAERLMGPEQGHSPNL